MKIAERSPQRLVLRDRSFWIGIVCLAAALLLVVVGYGQPKPANLWVTGGLFLVFGLAFFNASQLVLDRNTSLVSLERLSCFGRSRKQWRFDEIQDVEIQLSPNTRTPMCRLALVTTAGNVPLSNVYEPDMPRFEAMRAAMLKTLDHPGADAPPPDPVRQLVRQGRSLDAIKLLRQREDLDLASATARVQAMQKESA